jgi:Leucine-rich repeat (LRR) protein
MNFDYKTGALNLSSSSKQGLDDVFAIDPLLIKSINISKVLYIKHFDFSGMVNLTFIHISSMGGIGTVDLSNNINLKHISFYKCKSLYEIILPENNMIYHINISKCYLKEFYIESDHLKELQLRNNLLTNIDISKCPLLSSLNLDGNYLTSIDLKDLKYLKHLTISNNRVEGVLDLHNIEHILFSNYVQHIDSGASCNNNLETFGASRLLSSARKKFELKKMILTIEKL